MKAEAAAIELHAPVEARPNETPAEAYSKTNGAVATLPRVPEATTKAVAPPRAFFKPLAITLVVMLLAALLWSGYFLRRRTELPLTSQQTMQITKLTANGQAGVPVLSPDGKYVA
jgi:hypothetical protein